MVEKNSSNKILTIVLIVIICISAIVVLYVNLPKDETTDNDANDTNGIINNNQTKELGTVLTIIYEVQKFNYTMEEIKAMPSYTGTGGKIKETGSTIGPYNYTGVKMTTLLAEFEELPVSYSIDTNSSDGYVQHYTYDEIQGFVGIFNETNGTRVSIGNSSTTMIIAYNEEGQDITDPKYAPLMIVFVDDYYTDSSLWAKHLAWIEIIEE